MIFLLLALTAVVIFASRSPVASARNSPVSPTHDSSITHRFDPHWDDDNDDQASPPLPGSFPSSPPSPLHTPLPPSPLLRPSSPPVRIPISPPTVIVPTLPRPEDDTPLLPVAPSPPEEQSPPPPPRSSSNSSPLLRVDLPPTPTFTSDPPPISSIADTPAFEFHDPLQSSSSGAVYYDAAGQALPGGHEAYDDLIAVGGDDMYFDDDGLGTLEKIYLFARSKAIFHRVFIARSLPNFLPDVKPIEAVEYVLPLVNSLGTDPEESVREAFVTELVPAMWWFYTHCQLVDQGYWAIAGSMAPTQQQLIEDSNDHERDQQSPIDQDGGGGPQSLDHGPLHFALEPLPMEDSPSVAVAVPDPTTQETYSSGHGADEVDENVVIGEEEDLPPLLPVQVFTPLLGSLLLSTNQAVSDGGRMAVVELLRRLQAPSETEGVLGEAERQMLERELLIGVVIGMARMDLDPQGEYGVGTTLGIPPTWNPEDGDAEEADEMMNSTPEPVLVQEGHQDQERHVWTEVGEMAAMREMESPTLEAAMEVPIPESPTVSIPSPSETVIAIPAASPARLPSPLLPSEASDPATEPPIPEISLEEPQMPVSVTPPSPPTSTVTPQPNVLPIPFTAHLTHLTPTSSRPVSPFRSAPHTPPSPTLRPVRLPSSESSASVSIPGTPFEVGQSEMLGLDVLSSDPPPPRQLPLVPIYDNSMFQQQLDEGDMYRRRPILSPMQPSTQQQQQHPLAEEVPQRTESFSSDTDKSESTPTEGSSGETVTPSESPVVRAEAHQLHPALEDVPLEEMGPAFPPDMSFRSVPVSVSHTPSATSPSDSTPQSAASATSLHSSSTDTPLSSEDSEVLRTPESPQPNTTESSAVTADDDEGEHQGLDAEENPYFLSAEGLFRPNSSRRGSSFVGGGNSSNGSKNATSGSDSGGTERGGGDVGNETPPRAKGAELEMTKHMPSFVSPVIEENPDDEDAKDEGTTPHPTEDVTPNVTQPEDVTSRSTESTSPTGSPVVSLAVPQRSPSFSRPGRPESVPLPPPTLDSPYPSPPTQGPFDVGPMLIELLEAESRPTEAESLWQEPEATSSPEQQQAATVRLPSEQPIPEQEPLTRTDSNSNNSISNQSERSWIHTEGDQLESTASEASTDADVGRVASMSLVAAVTAAGVLGEETKQVFTDEVVRVGRNPVYWVRREAAYALGALAKVVVLDALLSALLPLYEDLTADADFHVRSSGIFALPGILTRLPVEERRNLALRQCRALSHDPEKAVRSALLEVMGEVIYAFREDEGGPPTELVDLFIGNNEHDEDSLVPVPAPVKQWGLVKPLPVAKLERSSSTASATRAMFEAYNDPSSSQYQGLFGVQQPTVPKTAIPARDPERVLICAFNFPAVVAALGPTGWPQLRLAYRSLASDPAAKVRRSIGASIGEIARIVGEEHTRADLISVWWDLIHDDDLDVRSKVVGCVDTFVESLGVSNRKNVGLQLESVWSSVLTGWRERESLASQLGSISAALAVVDRAESARVLMLGALTDTMAAVREAAISSYPQYMDSLVQVPKVFENAMNDLKVLATSDSFRKRSTVIAAYNAWILYGEDPQGLNDAACQATIDTLSHDAVIDVRIGLSRLIGSICSKHYPDRNSRPAWIQAIVRRLSRDTSREVRSFVAFLARRPSSLATNIHHPSSDSSSSRRSTFATFSRPPNNASLLTDSLDDLMNMDGMDLEADDEDASPALFSEIESTSPLDEGFFAGHVASDEPAMPALHDSPTTHTF